MTWCIEVKYAVSTVTKWPGLGWGQANLLWGKHYLSWQHEYWLARWRMGNSVLVLGQNIPEVPVSGKSMAQLNMKMRYTTARSCKSLLELRFIHCAVRHQWKIEIKVEGWYFLKVHFGCVTENWKEKTWKWGKGLRGLDNISGERWWPQPGWGRGNGERGVCIHKPAFPHTTWTLSFLAAN